MRADAARLRIADRDATVRAWVALAPPAALRAGPLAALALGVKDIIDVAGLPTGCGTPVHAGHVATIDAALVAELRALGAAVIGKTATAELAFLVPPPTRNPLDLARSPGGSSSGSAAAVADGHVDAALATQTAGSIIRPAAFCGVVGFKPTRGRFARAGVKVVAPSLDTIGWISRDVATAARIEAALASRVEAAAPGRLGYCRTAVWSRAEPAMREALLAFADRLDLPERPAPAAVLDRAQEVVMRFEMRRELAAERLAHRALLSPALLDYVDRDPPPEADWRDALALAAGVEIDALFGPVDVLATPAAPGEAVPFGATGDPCFSRAPTLLGLPAVTIPFARGPAGLPLGLQLLGRPGEDATLLATAAALERRLAAEP